MSTAHRSGDATTPHIGLYFLRRNRGWSQRDLANLVGVSREYVSLIESGKQAPSTRFKAACVELFDTPEGILLARPKP